MSLASELSKEIENGRNGKSGIIPIQLDRVGNYFDICKNTYYNIGGETGGGKTSFVQDIFVIRTIEWYLKNKNPNIKLSIIGFFMERKMYQYTARWISRKIFEDYGLHVSPKKVLSRRTNDQMTLVEYKLVQSYYDMLDQWEKDDLLIVHEGSFNPTGISIYLEMFARKHGTIIEAKKVSKEDRTIDNVLEKRKYIPNHPNHIVLVIGDNSDILTPEEGKGERELVMKYSRTMREARDLYGFSPVNLQQLNAEMSGVQRQKMGDLKPKLSDFATCKQIARDSDVVMALFNPFAHAVTAENENDNGFNLNKLIDNEFKTYYRSIHILKNSFDSSGMQFPLAISPEYGIFSTLPKRKDITDNIYHDIISGEYFRSKEKTKTVNFSKK